MATSKDSTDLSRSRGGLGAALAAGVPVGGGASPPAAFAAASGGRVGSKVRLSKGRRKNVEPVVQVRVFPSRDQAKLSAPISVTCTVGTAGENRLVAGASPPTWGSAVTKSWLL